MNLVRNGKFGATRLGRLVLFVLVALVGALGLRADDPPAGRVAVLLPLDGAVSPATADFLIRGIQDAAERDAGLVVIRMDTPGGLDSSMRAIIREILASPVPVATYVAPSGARAASAGTYILMASHVAVMAPSTSVGAATPVAIGGGSPFDFGNDEDENDANDEEAPPPTAPRDAGMAKAINDAVAYIRGIAELRERNADWAEKAVREAATLTSSEALRENVIDFNAESLEDLLEQADGMTVQVGRASLTLETADLVVEEQEPDWRTRVLAMITDPNVAIILMMIGIYGIIFELINPGALFPGTIGGISLLMGLYALAVLPVTFAGVALILLGTALVIAEAFAPSFGILGIGGAVALILGLTLLFDTDVPGVELSWGVIGAVGVASVAFSLLVTRLAVTSHQRKVTTGREEMVGTEGKVLSWSGDTGYILIHGERWRARADAPLTPGDRVVVTALRGLTLTVAKRAAAH